ncbi:hypothetical protein HDU97_000972 [Phlyctochytrium planicorne]|nr:hypothetical protein HDU97_000972 [Phlyctochytrium planicorne]
MEGGSEHHRQERIGRFVSRYVRTVLKDREKREMVEGELPFVEDGDVAVIMIDISGYSLLTSNLIELGKISSEMITRHIGDYLKEIIDVVEIYGGDITRFLGDGFLATFERGSKSLPESIQDATSCCLHIMKTHPTCIIEKPHAHDWSSKQQEPSESYKMTLHVAVAAGPVQHVIMGSINGRMDYVVNGKCLHELGIIIDEAKSGELGISTLVWTTLSQTFPELQTLPQTHFRTTPTSTILHQETLLKTYEILIPALTKQTCRTPPVPPKPSETIPGYIPSKPARLPSMSSINEDYNILERFLNQSLLHKIKQNDELGREISLTGKKQAIKNEFRQLSIVFAKLDFEFTPRRAQMILSLFLKCIALHGGVFQQYSVDDKGQTMLAFFGLPPYTHENDARRALKASAEFRKQASAYRFGDIYVSVSTGDIMFASIGSEYRSEASFLGDAVNVAARVIGLKIDPQVVVCDDKTRTSAEGLSFTYLGQYRIKGKSAPIELHSVTMDSFDRTERKTFDRYDEVGYCEERRCLVKLFSEWYQKERQGLAMVEGASGMGKSSLTRGSEVDQWTPYSSLREVFQHIYQKTLQDFQPILETTETVSQTTLDTFATSTADTTRRSRGKSKKEPGGALLEFLQRFNEDVTLAPLLGSLLPNAIVQENEQTKMWDGKTRKGMLAEMVVRILCQFTAENKVVLVFDDSQSFFVFFTRPIDEHQNDALKQLRHHSMINYTCIRGFTKVDIEQLIISMYGSSVQEVSTKLVQAIFDRSGGSPLASGMMLEAIKIRCPDALAIEGGRLFFDSKVAVLEEVLSGSLSASITIQFDRIHVLLQEFLKKSCILGQYFRITDALSLMETSNTVHDALDWISQHDRFHFLIVCPQETDADPTDTECYFRHIAIRNTIYDSLPFEERQCLHLASAKYFEKVLVANECDNAMLPTVALHFYRSGDIPKTVTYLEKLALLHLKKFLFQECISTTQKLLNFVDSIYSKATPNLDPDLLSTNRRALWYSMLAISNAHIKDLKTSYSEALRVLDMIGQSWPKTKRESRKLLLKAMVEQYKLFKRTKGGLTKCKLNGPFDSPRMLAILSMTHKALMYYCLYLPESLSTLERMLILFWNLNSAIKLATTDPAVWITLCLHSGVALYWKIPKLGSIYIKAALESEKATRAEGSKISYGLYLFETFQIKESMELFSESIKVSIKIGDIAVEFAGLFFISLGHTLRGNLSRVNEIWTGLGDQMHAATEVDTSWPILMWCNFIRTSLLQDNTSKGESALGNFNNTIKGSKSGINFGPCYNIGKAWIEIRNKGNPEVITKYIQDMAKGMQGWNGYHIAYIDASFTGIVPIWVLAEQCLPVLENDKSGVSSHSFQLLQIEQINILRWSAESIAKMTRVSKKMPLTAMFGRFYDAAGHMYKKGGRRKGLESLRRLLKDKKYVRLFQYDLKLLRACGLAFLAVYTTAIEEKRATSLEARELLESFGATFLVDWLNKNRI